MKFESIILGLLAVHLTSAFPFSLPSIFSRDLTSSTQNDLLNGSPCKDVTVIFGRGTTSEGNVGESTGPPFFQAIAKLIGADKLAVQGVDYPATILGFLQGGDPAGSTTMANLVERAFSQCPNTKVVLSGYSQGAQLVHNAGRQLTAASAAKVSSVVTFGDPFKGAPVGTIPSSKILIICHEGDNICDGGILVLPPHRNYAMDAPAAAEFVRAKAGL